MCVRTPSVVVEIDEETYFLFTYCTSLLAFTAGHIKQSPWRYMYFILGIATFLWGFVLLTLLPDDISHTHFLLQEERQIVSQRAKMAGMGDTDSDAAVEDSENHHHHQDRPPQLQQKNWRREQTIECLVDPQTWLMLGMVVLTQIANGGMQTFSNLVIKSFGFSALESTLINIPTSLLSSANMALTGYAARRFSHMHCLLIVVVVALSTTGSALIYTDSPAVSKGVRLVGAFFTESIYLSIYLFIY